MTKKEYKSFKVEISDIIYVKLPINIFVKINKPTKLFPLNIFKQFSGLFVSRLLIW